MILRSGKTILCGNFNFHVENSNHSEANSVKTLLQGVDKVLGQILKFNLMNV